MSGLLINKSRKYCYRICHVRNLPHILACGLCTKHHPDADPDFIQIGNPGIISVRDDTRVKISHYGNIGDYVPFYFTPRSIMQYNIVTGYWEPEVPKLNRQYLLVIECRIEVLAGLERFLFTDGQANAAVTTHYNDLQYISAIDWLNIQHGHFHKSDGDFDRPRRYQAEFLVHHHVPVESINALFVHNEKAATFVKEKLKEADNKNLKVHVQPELYF
ncbi:MAG: DUF4433 domain-containing protein [Taibaiella sp.]|nr:DUF4433 domain-containing protein [Taibaiella sp.]